MPDVFLSYSSKDRAAADRVQAALTARGFDVFWDQETPAGQDWDTWIRNKLSACRVAVVLWSRTSIASDNVRHEALVARKAEKLVPAMIEPIPAEDLPMGLYMVQTLDLSDWRNANSKGMARLADEIAARLGGGAAKAATPIAKQQRTGGLSPKAQTTVALIAIAAVVAGIAWFMLPQSPKAAPEVGQIASTPCPNGGVPILGVCPEPAPAAQPVSVGKFAIRTTGHWNWDGLACADGPNVTIDRGRLVFTAPSSRYVHAIKVDNDQSVHTRVESCTGCAPEEVGNAYVLSPEYVATDAARSFNLVVENTSKGTRDTWSPCETTQAPANPTSLAAPTYSAITPEPALAQRAAERSALMAFVGTWKTTTPGRCDPRWRFELEGTNLIWAWQNEGDATFRVSNMPLSLRATDPPTVSAGASTYTLEGGQVVETFQSNDKVCKAARE